MSTETITLILTGIGVIVAIGAWLFPKKMASSASTRKKGHFIEASIDGGQNSPVRIEVAKAHLAATVYDDEKTEYIIELGKRAGEIGLSDLSSLIGYLVYDDNKVSAIRAYSGKVSPDYSAEDYRKIVSRFAYSENRQKVEKYINNC